MNRLKIWFKFPRLIHREVNLSETIDYNRKVTTLTEDKLKGKDMLIPVSPSIHPQGLQELVMLKDKACYAVAILLISGLHSSTQKNIVEVSITELCEKSLLSRPSIIKGIDTLVSLEYIIKRGKQKYYISPKLAWFGSQSQWAIELKLLGTRKETI